MTLWQRTLKRTFDVVVSSSALLVTGPIIIGAILVARRSTGLSGLFRQERVGRYGETFTALKIRSMRPLTGVTTTVTTDQDPRITRAGRFFRKTKIDELPQLINVLRGDMSLVGARPDVPAQLAITPEPQLKELLCARPGMTGPASVKYRNEEELLAASDDPEWFNNHVIWPDKVAINIDYIRNWSLFGDVAWMIKTVIPDSSTPDLQVPQATQERRAA